MIVAIVKEIEVAGRYLNAVEDELWDQIPLDGIKKQVRKNINGFSRYSIQFRSSVFTL
jgi:hypothetical protein